MEKDFRNYWLTAKHKDGSLKGQLLYPQEYYTFDENQFKIDPNETVDELDKYQDDSEKIKEEWIKCANSFPYFAMKYVKIVHPKSGLIRFILYDYQRRVIENYDNHRYNLVSKFRQGGLTTLTTIWLLWRCMFKFDEQIMVMSKSDREAIKAGENVVVALNNLPLWMKPEMLKSNAHEHHFADTGCKLSFWAPAAARGQALTWFIIDEAAFVEKMDLAWRAMFPTISTGGACIAISTPNGIGNWYEETYRGALERRNKFNVIDLDYHENPDYNNPDWVKETHAQLGPKGWLQEVEKQFLGSGDTYISSDILIELTKKTKGIEPIRKLFPEWNNQYEIRNELENENWIKGALHIWGEHIDGREYIMSADVAEGGGDDENDNSCLEVFDQNTMEQVAEFYSNRIPTYMFAQIVDQVGKYYGNALCVVEANGPGLALLNTLQHTLDYENLYYDDPSKLERPGVKVGPANRIPILDSFHSRLISRSMNINSKRLVYELNTFIHNKQHKRPEAQKGKHDDAIMATSLIAYVLDKQLRHIPVGAEVPKEVTKIFDSDIYRQIREELARNKPLDYLDYDDEDEDILRRQDEDDILPGILVDWEEHPKQWVIDEFGWGKNKK